MKVQVVSGTTTTTLATYSNVGANATYAQKSFSLSSYKGKTVTVKFLDERGLLAADQLRGRRHLGHHGLTPQPLTTAAPALRGRRCCRERAVRRAGAQAGYAQLVRRVRARGVDDQVAQLLLEPARAAGRPAGPARGWPPLLTSRTMSSGCFGLPSAGVRRPHGTPPTARRMSLSTSGLSRQLLCGPGC